MGNKNCKNCSQNDCAYFGMDNKTNCKDFHQIALAQRTWVGLTHDEYDAICDKHSAMSDFDFLADIEDKLKEKNNA